MAGKILGPLIHDGIAYAPGDIVDAGLFSLAQTEHLVSSGTLLLTADRPDGEADDGADTVTLTVSASAPVGKSRKA